MRALAGRIAPHLALLAAAAGFVFLFSFSSSPLYLGYGGDSSVYKNMGWLILQGGTPYVDLYDNKGILLYLFNALGLLISPQWGICALQTLMLWGTLTVWDMMLREFGMGWARYAAIAVALLVLLLYYEGGGLTEDLSLLFISVPLYIWVKAERRDAEIPMRGWLAMGLCAGTLAFIRINNVLPFAGFYLWSLGEMAVGRKWKLLARSLGMAAAGFAVVAALCVGYVAAAFGWPGVAAMFDWMFAKNFSRILFHSDRGATLNGYVAVLPPPVRFVADNHV